MTQNPILKALSIFLKHKVQALLMGGQACIFYGAAEFSRDLDLTVMISSKNLETLKLALAEMEAEPVFAPKLSEEVLVRGHACHFRCQSEDLKGLRIDIMGVMRGVDFFPDLWNRREEIEIPEIGKIGLMGLYDLVKAKKTQRDKDWPMIRRLIEADIYRYSDNPSKDKICFWLAECRTSELLISLAFKYQELASHIVLTRPLLKFALEGNIEEIEKFLHEEEDRERELDRQYWKPLKAELEAWRREMRKQ